MTFESSCYISLSHDEISGTQNYRGKDGAPQLVRDIDTSNISVISIAKMPSYNIIYDSNANSMLDRTFKGLLLPMLKDLIRGRVMSSGVPCVSTIIKDKFYQEIYYSRLRFQFDHMNDFRLALKIVSWNKIRDENNISCFSAEEAYLCNKLRSYGNTFVHNAELPPGFVDEVLMSTQELLFILKTDNNVDFKKYNLMFEEIKLMV